MSFFTRKDLVCRGVQHTENGFSCGICQNTYEDRVSARHCLYRCLIKFSEKIPVKAHRHAHQKWFRCQICCRDYKSSDDAQACHRICADDLHVKLRNFKLPGFSANKSAKKILPPPAVAATLTSEPAVREPAVSTASGSEDPQQFKFYQAQTKYACSTCHKTFFSKDDVYACYDGHQKALVS